MFAEGPILQCAFIVYCISIPNQLMCGPVQKWFSRFNLFARRALFSQFAFSISEIALGYIIHGSLDIFLYLVTKMFPQYNNLQDILSNGSSHNVQ